MGLHASRPWCAGAFRVYGGKGFAFAARAGFLPSLAGLVGNMPHTGIASRMS